jgi:uncharacterized YccA/Bax inhibitor family protein
MVKTGGVLAGLLLLAVSFYVLTQFTLANSNLDSLVGFAYLIGTILSGFGTVVGLSSTIKSLGEKEDPKTSKK